MRKKKATETALPKKLYIARHSTDYMVFGDTADSPSFYGYKSPNRIPGGKDHVGEYVLVEEGTTQTFLMPKRS